jgi:hypothetical protein
LYSTQTTDCRQMMSIFRARLFKLRQQVLLYYFIQFKENWNK